MTFPFRIDALKMGWRESLDAFKPSHIGFLLLVSLRALKDFYKTLIHAWFIPTALLAGLILDLKSLLCAFYVVFIARAVRPSIDQKKGHYWTSFNVVDWTLFVGLFIIVYGIRQLFLLKQQASTVFFLLAKIYDLLLKAFFLGTLNWLPGSEMLGLLTYFLSPFVILWVLFMLDSKKTVFAYIQACGRAILMFVYNYPFFLFSYLALRLIISLTYLASRPIIGSYEYLPLAGWIVLFALLLPFYICFIMSFYVKQLHEQFGLYYKS